MNSLKGTKINRLLRVWPKGTVAVQAWLSQHDIDRKLMDAYCRNNWVERIAPGAYVQFGDQVDWSGAVYTLQQQLAIAVHIGASSALDILGLGHYIPLGKMTRNWLFVDASEKKKMPKWFLDLFAAKQHQLNIVKTNLFLGSPEGSLVDHVVDGYSIQVSTPERAILECLYLVPDRFSIEYASELIEQARTLRPAIVEKHLIHCNFIKVKRLFLYFAELHGHSWIERINLSKIDLGNGVRQIGEGGYYNAKYKLSLPITAQHEGYNNDDGE